MNIKQLAEVKNFKEPFMELEAGPIPFIQDKSKNPIRALEEITEQIRFQPYTHERFQEEGFNTIQILIKWSKSKALINLRKDFELNNNFQVTKETHRMKAKVIKHTLHHALQALLEPIRYRNRIRAAHICINITDKILQNKRELEKACLELDKGLPFITQDLINSLKPLSI